MFRTTTLWCGIGLAWVGPLVAAEAPAGPMTDEVDAIFADYDSTQSPGCSLGVIRDGELVYARGYGMASLDQGVPLTSRSVFRIGSTSKQFTAFSIHLLVDQGKVELDTDIRTYLPELPEYQAPVTIRQLIHHTSGYRDYLALTYLAGVRDADYYTDAEVLDMLSRQKELNFEPGAEHLYSNSGYFLLGQIVLRASGKTLREFAAEEIFGPLGMRQTHFHDDHQEIVPQRAVGYGPTEIGFQISQTTLEMIGDGGVFTSVEDMARWDANFYEPRVGTPATLKRMVTPGRLNDGEMLEYASGLSVSDYRGLKMVSHGGGFVGYRAEMIRFPTQQLSVVCLCNRADAYPSTLAKKVANLYLADELQTPEGPKADEQPEIIDLPANVLARHAGAYRRENSLQIYKVNVVGDRLQFVWSPRTTWSLAPITEDRFIGEDTPYPVELRFEEEGATFFFGGGRGERSFERVELFDPTPGEVASLAGDYRCDELMTSIKLRSEGNTLWLERENPHTDKPEAAFVPTLADTFDSEGLTIQVSRDGKGMFTGIRLGVGRVRNIECVLAN